MSRLALPIRSVAQRSATIVSCLSINTRDAGWYQIKALAKEYIPDTLKQFNELYKAFEDRMRPLVYELGCLYK